ncbi:MAG: DUF1616 domain-containing protein, partial [candidate division SR1 bacterium]|nr:DUF1616 domain-containing protein [candidate division SR1 bacterium]
MQKLTIKQLTLITSGIALMVLLIIFLPWQDVLIIKTLRIIFGSVFVLFLPGYWLTLSFFGSKEIDLLERFALSFALSISVIPLLTFYINLIGVKITQVSVWAVVVVVIAGNWAWLRFRKKKNLVG